MAPPSRKAGSNRVSTDTFRISDAGRTARFSVAPGLGCNLCSWVVDGTELLFVPDGFLEGAVAGDGTAHLGGGNPVLFPAVGRTWDLTSTPPQPEAYRITGRTGSYRMPMHGVAGLLEWNRISNPPDQRQAAESGSSPSLVVEYEGRIHRELREKHYPFDVGLRLKYGLTPDTVTVTTVVTNHESTPSPFALGFHPYFRVSRKERIEVVLPCTTHVHLDSDLLIPNGETEALRDPVLRFRDDQTYDMAFGNVSGDHALIRNARTGLDIRVGIDRAVAMFVVYSGARTPFVCVEPWTRGLGGYTVRDADGEGALDELEVLAPAETREITIRYTAIRAEGGCTEDTNGG